MNLSYAQHLQVHGGPRCWFPAPWSEARVWKGGYLAGDSGTQVPGWLWFRISPSRFSCENTREAASTGGGGGSECTELLCGERVVLYGRLCALEVAELGFAEVWGLVPGTLVAH